MCNVTEPLRNVMEALRKRYGCCAVSLAEDDVMTSLLSKNSNTMRTCRLLLVGLSCLQLANVRRRNECYIWHISLKPQLRSWYIIRKPINIRFYFLTVHVYCSYGTEILSTLHTQVEHISAKNTPFQPMGEKNLKTFRNLPFPSGHVDPHLVHQCLRG